MIAIIIFGTRGVRSTVKEGNFICPQCADQRNYKHKKVTQFFTLYFIPLIPLGNKGEYVECLSCRNTYVTRVLELSQLAQEKSRPQNSSGGSAAIGAMGIAAAQSNATIDIEPEKNKVIKKLLIMMILADGVVDNAEIQTFHRVYKESTGQVVVDLIKDMDEVRTENKSAYQYLKGVVNFINQEGKEAILKASMQIAAADGAIDPSEIRMVENFGKALEMKPAEVKVIIESIKQVA